MPALSFSSLCPWCLRPCLAEWVCRKRFESQYVHGRMDAWAHACVHAHMDAWVDGQVHACMRGWVHAWVGACVGGCMSGWTGACLHARVGACTHGCMSGWTGACLHAWVGAWMRRRRNGRTHTQIKRACLPALHKRDHWREPPVPLPEPEMTPGEGEGHFLCAPQKMLLATQTQSLSFHLRL